MSSGEAVAAIQGMEEMVIWRGVALPRLGGIMLS
jgi:hypothetical protein